MTKYTVLVDVTDAAEDDGEPQMLTIDVDAVDEIEARAKAKAEALRLMTSELDTPTGPYIMYTTVLP